MSTLIGLASLAALVSMCWAAIHTDRKRLQDMGFTVHAAQAIQHTKKGES